MTDLYINGPGVFWVESLGGGIERHEMAALTGEMLARLARQIAAFSSQGISREHPILSATLPNGARVQIVAPPATRGELAIAIRKHASAGLTLKDLVDRGSFAAVNAPAETPPPAHRSVAGDSGGHAASLAAAVHQRKNILISGGTSTGKTTLLNALMKEIPAEERLILIEDAPELELTHENAVGLLAARSSLREAAVTTDDLLNAALRMRPDRIILGEIRGGEAFTFLRAINTGHPGSLTTIHADSPERAVEQLALLVLQSGARLSWEDVVRYVRSTVDLYVQVTRFAGKRRISVLAPKLLPDARCPRVSEP
ncbi:P-type DNA transfer ATPase VirB11 [Phenylobacterium sp. LjRoot225]|uniref:P-type DNA transfer ATPase VirB11 n=1 Tax=Phenylobacterium sp. LjRoot225 TaxID=3342285 RepID=UPI003ECFCB23